MRGTIITGLALAASLGIAQPSLAAPDWKAVQQALGKSGQEVSGGIYRVGLPRSDLKVTLDGLELKPALALGSWLAFKPMGDHDAMVMGDLVLTEPEIGPVMMKLIESGIEVTALHNHLQRAKPETMYMHVLGHGDPEKLATALHLALQQSGTPLSDAPASAAAASKAIDLDTQTIDKALGHKGKVNGGVYQISIPRAETIKDDGMDVPDAMGSAIAINFQPTGDGKAAITGDFVLIASEVNPVLRALRESGIEVTAVHNHMLDEQPRLFFVHFWANDDVGKLAKGLKLALGQAHLRTGS
ncbi:DUF1259 domain-containing protein [Mesorhizobium sp.]|uniref:DUF1259 domain-containing protein n=1 Tax=Mesorhizobium sp. TaxID=1871066 RepID=UPI000FE314F4|nr:DUF1259 domain-containing protein [Mesorhizobium sp.]RWH68476.1 MAG: DUF1259 domain-containing protein [Mesorhizobium sp.]RWL24879.1 MAG: DUF1259 domain-containing protein [Mesorhizobium sp.]RWL27190.1 MAG: DUF1259 domain-containing protein [Mesorhizobium sp.]RWL31479.1 MAG: DUF1259 domain-containing protein [Mesorhizobium sp.]RWL51045.1 MAG: DUF1259 domain-containing protein [Mesorhizobium sp.]